MRESSGKAGVLSHVLRDMRYALRQLTRNPGFAATAILILAVAIGASTAIFSAFDALVLRPLPYRDPEQLVSDHGELHEVQHHRDATCCRGAGRPPRDDALVLAPGRYPLRRVHPHRRGAAEGVSGLRVSASIFPMLDVQPILGSPFRTEDEEYGKHRVVVISEGLWRRRFGADPNIVGTSIEINRESYRVAAVSRPILDYLGTAWDLWVPLSFQPGEKDARQPRRQGRGRDRAAQARRDDRGGDAGARGRDVQAVRALSRRLSQPTSASPSRPPGLRRRSRATFVSHCCFCWRPSAC